MWWNLSDARYEIPKDGNRHSMFAGALWIGGVDDGGQLKVAAMTYRQSGNDFWPGPLDETTASITAAECAAWDKHFKITREEVENHVANYAINPTTGNYELWIKTIEPDFGSFVNHQFTVNNAPTSINDELKIPFDIYPNPTSNSIIAKGTASNNGYIQLDDTFGKTLYKGSIKKGSYNILIDLSDYANGVYFLKVSFKDSRIVRKVLKQ